MFTWQKCYGKIHINGVKIMLQNGIVKQITKKMADVEIQRGTACGESCASCGLCPGQTTVISAANDAGAAVGDKVIIDLADKKVLGAAFLVYIVPLIALFAGYFLCYAVTKNELLSALCGFLLLAVTFGIIILCDRKLKKRYTPKIVRILNNEGI